MVTLPNPPLAVSTRESIKGDGDGQATAKTLRSTVPNPASGIRTGWTSKSRSAIGKAWG
jgi:hypothetical protein